MLVIANNVCDISEHRWLLNTAQNTKADGCQIIFKRLSLNAARLYLRQMMGRHRFSS